ncbi:MAG: plastocyanin/azurin family copper-binding protein [Actinomycetes bacterium]
MRHSPRPAPALVLAACLTVAGCATTAKSTASAAEPDDRVVELVGLEFNPSKIQIAVGQRVRWQWTDSVVHNVVSKDFASSKTLSGGSYAVRFDRAGTFPYTCTLHKGMDGTVVVTP